MSSFNLKIPMLSSSNLDLSPQPKEMEEWIRSIPVADVAKASNTLYAMLKKLNRLPINPQTRFQIAELFAPIITQITLDLENYLIKAKLPFSKKIKSFILMRIKLIEELAFSYKWVIYDVSQSKPSYGKSKLLLPTLFQAMRMLVELLYASCLAYQDPPELLWKELHNLFIFAQENNLLFKKFKTSASFDSGIFECNIQDLYYWALILSISDTTRLRQREIRELYRTIPTLIKHVFQRRAHNTLPSSTIFVVQTDKDNPPQSSMLPQIGINDVNLIFDTGTLISYMEKSYDRDSNLKLPGITESYMDKNIIQRLVKAWSSVRQRDSTRTKLNFELPLAVGFDAIHNLLTENTCNYPNQPETENMVDESELDISKETAYDTDFIVIDTEQTSSLSLEPIATSGNIQISVYEEDYTKSKIDEPKHKAKKNTVSPYITLSTVNESTGGFCVDWPQNDQVPGIQIGELIGISKVGPPLTHSLAMVRWVQNDATQGLRVGLQIIANTVKAVSIVDKSQKKFVIVKSLLIPITKSTEKFSNLITPPLILDSNIGKKTLFIREQDGEKNIILLEILETNSVFTRFVCKY
ncbi:hypothetical protein TI04_03670 [Achromatium sp. WMS2]|nr:hypothetical protein TI04_03670 [Achromatium sp. WMS2]